MLLLIDKYFDNVKSLKLLFECGRSECSSFHKNRNNFKITTLEREPILIIYLGSSIKQPTLIQETTLGNVN